MELESGCVAQLNNIKLRRHETSGWDSHKLINFEISLKNLNFSLFKKMDLHFNFSDEKVILDDKFDDILNSLDELDHKQKAMKKLEHLELTHDTHSIALFGIGTFTLIIIVALTYIVFSKLCPIARAIAKMANPDV